MINFKLHEKGKHMRHADGSGGKQYLNLVRISYSHVQLNHHIPTDYDFTIWREKRQK